MFRVSPEPPNCVFFLCPPCIHSRYPVANSAIDGCCFLGALSAFQIVLLEQQLGTHKAQGQMQCLPLQTRRQHAVL